MEGSLVIGDCATVITWHEVPGKTGKRELWEKTSQCFGVLWERLLTKPSGLWRVEFQRSDPDTGQHF